MEKNEFKLTIEEVYVIARSQDISNLYGLEDVLENAETSPKKREKIEESLIKRGFAERTTRFSVSGNLKLIFNIWSNPRRIITNEGKNIRKKEFYGVFIEDQYVLYVHFQKSTITVKYLPIMNLKNMIDLIFDYKEPARISKKYDFTYPTRDLELIINAAFQKKVQPIQDFIRTTDNALKAEDIYEISNLIKGGASSKFVIATVVNTDEQSISSCRVYITEKACYLYMKTESAYKRFKRSTILKGMLCDCIEKMLSFER